MAIIDMTSASQLDGLTAVQAGTASDQAAAFNAIFTHITDRDTATLAQADTLYLPGGYYRVDSTITIPECEGIEFVGMGMKQTESEGVWVDVHCGPVIYWGGTKGDAGPILQTHSMSGGHIRGIGFYGIHPADLPATNIGNCVNVSVNQSNYNASAYNLFEQCNFQQGDIGFSVETGAGGDNIAINKLHLCKFTTCKTGIYTEGNQVLMHSFEKCYFENTQTCVHITTSDDTGQNRLYDCGSTDAKLILRMDGSSQSHHGNLIDGWKIDGGTTRRTRLLELTNPRNWGTITLSNITEPASKGSLWGDVTSIQDDGSGNVQIQLDQAPVGSTQPSNALKYTIGDKITLYDTGVASYNVSHSITSIVDQSDPNSASYITDVAFDTAATSGTWYDTKPLIIAKGGSHIVLRDSYIDPKSIAKNRLVRMQPEQWGTSMATALIYQCSFVCEDVCDLDIGTNTSLSTLYIEDKAGTGNAVGYVNWYMFNRVWHNRGGEGLVWGNANNPPKIESNYDASGPVLTQQAPQSFQFLGFYTVGTQLNFMFMPTNETTHQVIDPDVRPTFEIVSEGTRRTTIAKNVPTSRQGTGQYLVQYELTGGNGFSPGQTYTLTVNYTYEGNSRTGSHRFQML
jgi:hypothetical protein